MKLIKENIILSFGIALVIISIGCGAFGYYGAAKMQTTQNQMEEIPWILEPSATYSRIETTDVVDRFVATLSENDERVLIDSTGKIIETLPGEQDYEGGFYDFTEGTSCGIKNADNEIIIPAKYAYIHQHGDYFVGFGEKDEPSIWNQQGKCLYSLSEPATISYLQDDLFYLFLTNKKDKNRAYFVHAETKEKEYASWGDTDILYIISDGNGGYIGESGAYFTLNENLEIDEDGPIYNEFGELSEGLRYAVIYDEDTEKDVYCYVDKNWKRKITLDGERPEVMGSFQEGKALIRRGNQLFCIDTNGTELFSFEVKNYNSNSIFTFYESFIFSDNFAAISLDGKKYGYIDETGEFIIPTVLDAAEEAKHGYAPAAIYNNGYHYGILKMGE